VLDVLDDFLFTLRRDGFAVSTPQAIDVARAACEVGFEKLVLREAIACIVVDKHERRPRFDQLFDRFFSPERPVPPDLWHRLLSLGFSPTEVGGLRDLLREMGEGERFDALLTGGAARDHLLASDAMQALFSLAQSPLKRGFYTHQMFDALGIARARPVFAVLREELAEAMGKARAEQLMLVLHQEIGRLERIVHEQLEERLTEAERRSPRGAIATLPFTALSVPEREQVRRAVRRLAERLRGAARVRDRHRRRGRLDPARTMRKSLATGGVPFRPVRVDRRRDRPKLALLCDVSESVRPVSSFMLELVYAMQDIFERARSFVFVSDVYEVTELFREEPVSTALAKAANSVGAAANSSYGRALKVFETRHADAVDHRTTLVVLGDGRTNYQAHGAEVLARIGERSKRVIWLCTEPRASWGTGDSAMGLYARHATQVLEVTSARDLERAAREIVGSG
jgi:uncharacterized protein with von Willebrand factor type A (vWA) domain